MVPDKFMGERERGVAGAGGERPSPASLVGGDGGEKATVAGEFDGGKSAFMAS